MYSQIRWLLIHAALSMENERHGRIIPGIAGVLGRHPQLTRARLWHRPLEGRDVCANSAARSSIRGWETVSLPCTLAPLAGLYWLHLGDQEVCLFNSGVTAVHTVLTVSRMVPSADRFLEIALDPLWCNSGFLGMGRYLGLPLYAVCVSVVVDSKRRGVCQRPRFLPAVSQNMERNGSIAWLWYARTSLDMLTARSGEHAEIWSCLFASLRRSTP